MAKQKPLDHLWSKGVKLMFFLFTPGFATGGKEEEHSLDALGHDGPGRFTIRY